jgi:hypothetical protein
MAGPGKASIQSELIFASEAFARELGIADQLGNAPAMKKALLDVASVWIETDLNPHWMVAFRLLPQNGMPVIAELRIFPREDFKFRPTGEWSASHLGNRATAPAGGITAPMLRDLKLTIVRRKMKETVEVFRSPESGIASILKLIDFPVSAPRTPRKKDNRGRPPLPDLEFARIADFYVRRCEVSRTPVQDTARHFRISIVKARARLHEARKRELLTGGRDLWGIAGGFLTEKAKQILGRGK